MGPHEPYWRTNTSFSPPSLDFQFQGEALSFGSNDGNQLYGSSASSNSRGSRSWLRSNQLPTHQYLVPDGAGTNYSSPSEINVEGYDSAGSTSSRSDSTSHRNFSSRSCFMSKPIHPFSQREKPRLSSASGSLDLTDISEQFEPEVVSSKSCNLSETFRCGLCERFLTQRSPWSSRRIVRSGDMPVAGVLSCRHVFHAECLEQTTSKSRRNDPPCPICSKVEEGSSPDQRAFSKFFPRLKHFGEDGPSKPWGCAHAGDCVQGALQGPPRNAMLSLNRNWMRKNLSLKGSNPGKEFPGKLRKTGTFPSPLHIGSADHAAVGSSMTAGSTMK